ncbi:DegT/DnrJ/EryC1/StrS family aminotransferase [Paenilisteria rocourtiae]|uniref:Pyridoxal phosphate-dependent aminotransferase EpsN n=1 Tax=Listeria rocourtiae TaxID=647910 RepID=A0A4R6ZJV4_9LIST|nr:aminotransferase class V-fold PLP-dependent enzyme [Listeria rocourtiae]EUJ47823.1 pyridoxal phosphate-dependent aminotransferase epsN [Listeria rocourtiae FSL F6-920]MBC1435068.1 aminotransferase class V-fold PLP-dependent enzyme [Listeria rocourtiae]MBC1604557.1 aminotransferase class V-fold PLP-dependent enzyme [Listeria rocourtiae]TDR52620.1 pyridoxal phosphate-dependent aminotransferase EpsN [Listeria rocourtiae]
MNQRILLSPPDMSGNELSYVEQAFQDNWIAPAGPHIDAFEEEIATFVGAKYGVAVSSGTAGLHLALIVAGVSTGDIVLCQSFTFAASVNPIIYQGATPVLIDSDQETWNMSADLLEEAFKKEVKVRAVVVTHIYGQVAEMKRIKALCAEYGAFLIEDACESLGSTYDGKHSGTIGDIGVYSFNGNKIMTTSGGGMVVTNHVLVAKQIKYLATQSKSQAPYYLHEAVGYNYRLSNVLAGIGRGQLQTLDKKIVKRRCIFEDYKQAFQDTSVQMMPLDQENVQSNRWLSVVLLENQNPLAVMNFLNEQGIESRLTWNPMHRQPFLKGVSFYKAQEQAISDYLFARGLCLPSGSNLSKEDQNRVVEQMISFCDNGKEVPY